MRIAALLVLGLFVCANSAFSQKRGPIVLSEMTDAEFEQTLDALRYYLEQKGRSGFDVESEVSLMREYGDRTTYRDSDVRALFPEILESDSMDYVCRNSGLVTFSFIGKVDDVARTLPVKTLNCDPEARGLFCELESRTASVIEDPHAYFYFDASVTRSEAFEVAGLYAENLERFESFELHRIGREGDEFLLQFGRPGRCWCPIEAPATVLDTSDGKRLLIAEEITRECP